MNLILLDTIKMLIVFAIFTLPSQSQRQIDLAPTQKLTEDFFYFSRKIIRSMCLKNNLHFLSSIQKSEISFSNLLAALYLILASHLSKYFHDVIYFYI